jgi:cytochrome P450
MAAGGALLGSFLWLGNPSTWFGSSGTPPGTLSPFAGIRALAKRDAYLRSFARWGPIFKMSQFGAPTICVTGMDRISELMRSHSDALGPSPQPFGQSIQGNFLRYMDDGTHTKYGRLFRRAMAGHASPQDVEFVTSLCDREFEAMSAVGAVSPLTPLHSIARRSLSRLLFGFGEAESLPERFDELAVLLARADIGRSVRRKGSEIVSEMSRLLVEQLSTLEDLGRATAADAPVLARLRQIDSVMPDRTCLENLVFMHKIATDNVGSLLLWLLHHWAKEKAVVARIRKYDRIERTAALEGFLSETLRLNQSEYIYRKVVREFEFEGSRFPRGWMVRACIWESHRSTDAFAHPDQFCLRLDPQDYDRRHFTPFGMGRHSCNGVDINNTICRAFLGCLANSFDVTVVHAEPLQRHMRHWGHWRPNHKVRATLTRHPSIRSMVTTATHLS